LFGREERATNAKIQFIIINQIVDRLRNGILLPILSDRAPNIGEEINTRSVAHEKLAPYRISGRWLSIINHCPRNIVPIAEKKKEFQKSYNNQVNKFLFSDFFSSIRFLN
jgi:hypothetical protein